METCHLSQDIIYHGDDDDDDDDDDDEVWCMSKFLLRFQAIVTSCEGE